MKRIKTCVRRAAKLGLLAQQTSLLIAMEFFSLRPANFSSNRNVALHARSLGPPALDQGSPNYIPRAKSGPRSHFIWFAKRFCQL